MANKILKLDSTGNNISIADENIGFVNGNTIDIVSSNSFYVVCSGVVGNNANMIFTSIPIAKRSNTTNITITKLTMSVYNVNGIVASNVDILSDSNYSVASTVYKDAIKLKVTKNSAWVSGNSNYPVTILINSLVGTFS